MGHDDDAIVLPNLVNKLFNPRRCNGVKGRAGLVHQDDFGIDRNGARNAQALLLAARKTGAGMVEPVLHLFKEAGLLQAIDDNFFQVGLRLGKAVNARAIAVNPEIILMDEPCSALDPIASARIEELIDEIRQNYCIIIVTHSMQQAARVSQLTAFFHLGDLVEFGDTDDMFTTPQDKRTQDYITGRFG